MNKIEMGKQYRRRDGGETRVLCTDAGGKYPVVVLHNFDNLWALARHTEFGVSPLTTNDNLIEVKPKIKVDCWLVVSKSGGVMGIYDSLDKARVRAFTWGDLPQIGAIIHVNEEVPEGEEL